MPRAEDIANYLAEIAPLRLCESWDNSGLLLDCGGEITSLLVALDITEEVVLEAEIAGCQLVVAHHPLIFQPITHLAKGDVVYRMIKKNISAVCAHTNLDAAEGGVSDVLAAIFELSDLRAFAGCGRVGQLPACLSVAQLAEVCKEKFKSSVRFCDAGKPICTLAVVGGSGGGLFAEAHSAGADCLITGEVGHHDALDARRLGMSTVAAGHFSTEYPMLPVLAERLAKRFPNTRVILSRRGRDPFITL